MSFVSAVVFLKTLLRIRHLPISLCDTQNQAVIQINITLFVIEHVIQYSIISLVTVCTIQIILTLKYLSELRLSISIIPLRWQSFDTTIILTESECLVLPPFRVFCRPTIINKLKTISDKY